MIAAGQGLAAEAVRDDGSYRIQMNAGVGHFIGDYGEKENTTLDVLNLSTRWYFDRAEFQVGLPYLRIDGGADISFVDGQPIAIGDDLASDTRRTESGWGDVTLRGEYYLRRGTSTSPWVIGLLRVTLPTGDEDKGLGSGATDVEVQVSLIQRLGRINWLADAGYTFVGRSNGLDPRNQLRLGAGASVPFGKDQRHSYYVYLENRTSRFSGSEDKRSVAVGFSTAFTQAKRVRLSTSVFFGLSDSTEDVGLYVSLGRRY
ncbi:MAG: transporter [Burkholderiales bacterium]